MNKPAKQADNYKPQLVTQAFKVIQGHASEQEDGEWGQTAAFSNGLASGVDLMTLVQLPARSLKRTVAFYVDVIGLSLTHPDRPIEGNTFVQTMPRVGPGLHLIETSDAEFRHLHGTTASGEPAAYVALYVKSLEALRARLVQAGTPIVQEPVSGQFLSFCDPEGHLLEAYERPDAESGGEFESNVTGFRHVRMHAADPMATAEFLEQAFNFRRVLSLSDGEFVDLAVDGDEPNQPMIRVAQAADMACPQPMHWMLDGRPKHALELHSRNIGELRARVLEHGGAVKERVEFTGCGGYLKLYTPDGHYLWVNQDLRYVSPDNYKPQLVTEAFKVVAGAIQSKEEGVEMETTASPIDNAVDSVFVHVADLRRSAEWYSMVMGLPLLEERLNGGNVYWLQLAGGTGLILDDNGSNGPEVPHVRFMYKTADIEASYRYLEEKGVPLYPIERPHPGLAFLRFRDPDGNSIMVTQSDYVSGEVERLKETESPILNRIGGVFLHVREMNQAIRFHSETLGLPYREVESGPEHSIYDMAMKSGSGLLLDDNRFRNGDDYEALFMLVSPDIPAAKAYLAANGAPVFTDIETHGDLSFFTIKDPDGNVVMICS